jgi:6-pyruvoyltetrahydropterin/6-carboxytetrahydropterin synthase
LPAATYRYHVSLELTQEFYFESALPLSRDHHSESSRRLHGHTYHAEVMVCGDADDSTGMVVDLAALRSHIESVRVLLDHRLLNEVEGLGQPTIERLAQFVGRQLRALEPRVVAVRVGRRASGDSCLFRLLPHR